MSETVPHSGMSEGVTFCQVVPPSRVTWTRPSSLPAQIVFASRGLGAMVNTTP